MADAPKFGSFGMEKMKQKDEEERIKRMNTKQKRGTPTVYSTILNNLIIVRGGIFYLLPAKSFTLLEVELQQDLLKRNSISFLEVLG